MDLRIKKLGSVAPIGERKREHDTFNIGVAGSNPARPTRTENTGS